MAWPISNHWKVAKRILCYIKGTLHLSLKFWSSTSTKFRIFVDSIWAGDPDDWQSMTGACVFLGPNLVTWMSCKKNTVFWSKEEIEYRALAYKMVELRGFCGFLQELGIFLPCAPWLLSGSKSAVFMVHNPIIQARTCHMVLNFHYIWEFIANQRLLVKHIPTDWQVDDIFTKVLTMDTFRHH